MSNVWRWIEPPAGAVWWFVIIIKELLVARSLASAIGLIGFFDLASKLARGCVPLEDLFSDLE
jgi:hypothetical protein